MNLSTTTSMPEHDRLAWYKASASQNNGSCVEVARLAYGMAVRDSKNPSGTAYAFDARAWNGFLDTIRHNATQ
jgi:hypothetical protein